MSAIDGSGVYAHADASRAAGPSAAAVRGRLVDAHCHLGFMADGEAVAAAARTAGAGVASVMRVVTTNPVMYPAFFAASSTVPHGVPSGSIEMAPL